MKTISSSMTFFYKYIFFILWNVGFGAGALIILMSDKNEMPSYQFLGAWILGTIFIYVITGRIKKVDFDGQTFTISNFTKSITVDVSQVISISVPAFLSPKLITLQFKDESDFGNTIVFLPKFLFFAGVRQNPLVDELRKKCNL